MDNENRVLTDDQLDDVNGGTDWTYVRKFLKDNLDKLPQSYIDYFMNDLNEGRDYKKLKIWVCTNMSGLPDDDPVKALMFEAYRAG